MQDFLLITNIKIDNFFMNDFLENLQKINFREAEVNGRERIEFIKKQTPPVQFYASPTIKDNISTDVTYKKKDEVKKDDTNVDYYQSNSDTEVIFAILTRICYLLCLMIKNYV